MLKRALLGLLLAVALPSSANAHSALVGATPGAGSVLETFPSRIVLTFNEPLLALDQGRAHSIRITSPQGEEVELAMPEITGNELSASVATVPQEQGAYALSYRVVSNDGHPIEGNFTFSLSVEGKSEAPLTAKSENQSEVLKENGETGKALLIFLLLAGLSLVAYRKFIGRN